MMKILVVDDDPNILELVSIQLTQAGYTVMKASNGFEALRSIGRGITGFGGRRCDDAKDGWL